MPQANIRNDAPTMRVRNTDLPRVRSRYSGVLSESTAGTSFGGKGFLMGILALTYSKIQVIGASSIVYKSDDVPIVKIRNTD